MSEFFEPPPRPVPEAPPAPRAAVERPARGTLPGVVALEQLLTRSHKAASYITHLAAYPSGFEFEVHTIAASEDHELVNELDPDLSAATGPG